MDTIYLMALRNAMFLGPHVSQKKIDDKRSEPYKTGTQMRH
ncbi:MAG: hypothetical protein NXI01_03925 [Gammaproteobacteria bacterium]|nr:hypothetical protein [Gammaproteobacteria bacterium]